MASGLTHFVSRVGRKTHSVLLPPNRKHKRKTVVTKGKLWNGTMHEQYISSDRLRRTSSPGYFSFAKVCEVHFGLRRSLVRQYKRTLSSLLNVVRSLCCMPSFDCCYRCCFLWVCCASIYLLPHFTLFFESLVGNGCIIEPKKSAFSSRARKLLHVCLTTTAWEMTATHATVRHTKTSTNGEERQAPRVCVCVCVCALCPS